MRGEELPAPLTLRLYQGPEVLFSSDQHWLHPLFDLEGFFARSGRDPAATRLVDRITGRAAAFLVVRLGIRELDTRILSRRAVPVLERHGVRFRCGELVDRVTCATEDLLLDVQDPETAWTLLRERRLKALRTAPPPLSAAGPGTVPPAAAGSGESPGRG